MLLINLSNDLSINLFDKKSHTYTYIISSGKGREALIIDPVIEKTNEYLKDFKRA